MLNAKPFHVIIAIFCILIIVSMIAVPVPGWGQDSVVMPDTQQEFYHPLLLNSAWLRVGPAAQRADLSHSLLTVSPQSDRTIDIQEATKAASTFESLENNTGVNAQVAYTVWLMLRQQDSSSVSSQIAQQQISARLDRFELAASWGDGVATIEANDGGIVQLPPNLNPASKAVLSTLVTFTTAEVAKEKLRSLTWYTEFVSIFQQFFGDPLDTPEITVSSVTDGFRLPFAGNSKYNGGPHGGGSITACTSIAVDDGSGLDFHAPRVLAVAGGKILALQNDNLGGSIGKSVAVLHNTSGGSVVTMYWHLSLINPSLTEGVNIPQGMYIGNQGRGYNNAFGAHLHLELRTHNSSHDYRSYSKSGSPIRWDNKSVDSYLISKITNQSNQALNYQGTAVRASPTTKQIKDSSVVCSTNGRINAVVSSEYNRDVAVNDFAHTKFADPASSSELSSSNQECETNCGSTPPAPVPPPATCPSTIANGAIFYYDWHFECGGRGENSGWVRRESTGWQNMPGDMNDKASSVRVASGWSVKVYENGDRGGGSKCYPGSDDNFGGASENFTNGVPVNDRVSSFEVFRDGRCGEPEPRCPAPTLSEPGSGATFENGTVPFRWNDVSCNHSGFTFRVRTGPDMERDGQVVIDTRIGGTSHTQGFDSQWHYKDLYWSVRAANAPGGADWAPARLFRINPNRPPSVNLDNANGDGRDEILTQEQNWSFAGRASDPEGRLRSVTFRCQGDSCNDNTGLGAPTSFTHQRNGLSGRNQVWFTACDDRQCVDSRKVTLLIDRANPVADATFNGALPESLPAWFNSAVTVAISARDIGTGGAVAGVRELWYRLDGGAWQQRGGASASFDGGGDGTHTLEYYAIDRAGNTETAQNVSYRIDRTAPSAVGGVGESNGIANDRWQKAHNTPTFTWAASSDAGSGVWGYQFYFGADPNGIGFQSFEAAAERRWTPQPGGVRTGTYYLRGRSRDHAGNFSAWSTLYIYRYDGAPPENPAQATHAAGVANDTWQRTTSLPNFTWAKPADEGSDIKGYSIYWGSDPNGESAAFSTTPGYQSATPLCATTAVCTGYLRVRSVDNVDNAATKWSTTFVLRYDGALPSVNLTFNGGVTRTAQTTVILNLQAADQGSGVNAMRFSSDGVQWTEWEAFAAARPWTIPAIGRQYWPVYVQVRDRVGLESAVVMREVYFEVNAEQPKSEGYRLFDYAMSAGSGAHTSATYRGRSTVGQTLDSARSSSANFRLVGGYEAGSQAIPLVIPTHDAFVYVNGIFASGVVVDTMQSASFRMLGVAGEPALPNNATTVASANFSHQPGFLAAVANADLGPEPTPAPEPTPGPTPEPEPTPACEFPMISIDNGASFTGQTSVALSLCAPRAVQMMLSNDGGFGGAQWEPYTTQKSWTISAADRYVVPRFVYAAFKDASGAIQAVYFDDIILDPTPPAGSVTVGDSVPAPAASIAVGAAGADADSVIRITSDATYVRRYEDQMLDTPLLLVSAEGEETVDLYVSAQDDNSGVAAMQVSEDPGFANAVWEPYSALLPWQPQGEDGVKTLYVRFRDAAGNISAMTSASFVLDTIGPLGGAGYGDSVGGPLRPASTLFLGAEDNLTAVAAMRIGEEPDFSDAVWQPYNTTLAWSYGRIAAGAGTVYAQYRDLAGNVSEVYSTLYWIDLGAPDVYVEAQAGESLTRTLTVHVWDEFSTITTLRLSNDPLFNEGVLEMGYAETVSWTFDARELAWVYVVDGVGNVSDPYPIYIGNGDDTPETPTPEVTPHRLYLPAIQSRSAAGAAGENNTVSALPVETETPSTPTPAETPMETALPTLTPTETLTSTQEVTLTPVAPTDTAATATPPAPILPEPVLTPTATLLPEPDATPQPEQAAAPEGEPAPLPEDNTWIYLPAVQQ